MNCIVYICPHVSDVNSEINLPYVIKPSAFVSLNKTVQFYIERLIENKMQYILFSFHHK